jgi:hypothetical protein
MFGDWNWDDTNTSEQKERFKAFQDKIADPVAIIELGAGLAIPSIRYMSESLLIRNPK